MPFNDYGNVITITNSDSLFDHQIAISNGGVLKYRTTYNSNNFTSAWNEALTTTVLQKVVGVKQFLTTGLNAASDMTLQAFSENANFPPAISFHQQGSYAGSIALTATQYEFRNQLGNGVLNAKANQFLAPNGFVHQAVGGNTPNKVLTSNGGMAAATVDIVNDSGTLRVQDYFEKIASGSDWYGSVNPHKLVHLLIIEPGDIDLRDLQIGQRIVIMNESTTTECDIYINDGYFFTLGGQRKVTLYVSADNYFFYDHNPVEIQPY
jgi:hypothetical protein